MSSAPTEDDGGSPARGGRAGLEGLLAGTDEQFVRNAYRRLLGREPDPEGFGACLEQLRAGSTRARILGGIARSPESVARAGAAGGLGELVHAAEARDREITWPVASTYEELLGLADGRFVRCAYLTVLGRPAEPGGFHGYRGQLRAGISKTAILASLRESAEGRERAQLHRELDSLARAGPPALAGPEASPRIARLLALPAGEFPARASLLVLGLATGGGTPAYPLLHAADADARLRALGEMHGSARARELREILRRVDGAVRQQRWRRMPFAGPVLAAVLGLERDDEQARALRRMENQVMRIVERFMDEPEEAGMPGAQAAGPSPAPSREGEAGGLEARPARRTAAMLRTLPSRAPGAPKGAAS